MVFRIMWQFRKQPVIYLWTELAGKLLTPEELMQTLQSAPRLSGSTWEVVIYELCAVHQAIWWSRLQLKITKEQKGLFDGQIVLFWGLGAMALL